MLLEDIMHELRIETTTLVYRYMKCTSNRKRRVVLEHVRRYSVIKKIPMQVKYLDCLVNVTD